MATNDVVILKAFELNPELDINKLESTYKEIFKTVGLIVSEGKKPGVVITGLVSFEFSRWKLKAKAIKLIELLLEEDMIKLNRNFYIETLDEAREMITKTIAMYKMRKLYDNQNILSKQRKSK